MEVFLRASCRMIQPLTHYCVFWLSCRLWLYFEMFCFGFKKQSMSFYICVLSCTMNYAIFLFSYFLLEHGVFSLRLSFVKQQDLLIIIISGIGIYSPLVHMFIWYRLEYFLYILKTTNLGLGFSYMIIKLMSVILFSCSVKLLISKNNALIVFKFLQDLLQSQFAISCK